MSENENLIINYSLPHIIHNNLLFQFKNRPKNNKTPPSFPFELMQTQKKNETDKLKKDSTIQTFNINIILNAAALAENSLEDLLVSPLETKVSSSEKIIDVSLKMLKEEMIKISSLEKYFDYYKKIYNKSIR